MKKCWILREYRSEIERSYFDNLDIAISVGIALSNAGISVSFVYDNPITEYERRGTKC